MNVEKVPENVSGLPDGWKWNDYEDGSGSLSAPDGKSYFSYDMAPYHNGGGIEYKREKGAPWDVHWGTLTEFKIYAEQYIKAVVLNKDSENMAAENDTKDNEPCIRKAKSR